MGSAQWVKSLPHVMVDSLNCQLNTSSSQGRGSQRGVVRVDWPVGMSVGGVLTALNDEEGPTSTWMALSATLFLSKLIPLLILKLASSGFQRGLKASSSPGIS